MGLGIDLIGRKFHPAPIEVPCAVWAGRHTAPAADTPVVIDDHNTVRIGPGCGDRAALDTGRILTLLT